MKIIIDIPEETYKICKKLKNFSGSDSSTIISYEDMSNLNKLKYQVADGIIISNIQNEEINDIFNSTQRWIPCSTKQLPKEGERCLVTVDFDFNLDIEVSTYEDGEWWNPNGDIVVAWMPAPKPWKK